MASIDSDRDEINHHGDRAMFTVAAFLPFLPLIEDAVTVPSPKGDGLQAA
jgi:hypothetical protein